MNGLPHKRAHSSNIRPRKDGRRYARTEKEAENPMEKVGSHLCDDGSGPYLLIH